MSPKYVVPEEYKDYDVMERGWFYDWCTTENLDGALKEMREVVGGEWATNDLTIRNNYSRDQSPVKQVRPHIVVLPASTEEVSGVMKIAYERRIPVVCGSCRINQGGGNIPRRGGIVLDLVRMDKILDLDEEGMTITVQPFVDWAQLQLEGERLGWWEGKALYGCMPEAPACASVLGNTVSFALSFYNIWSGWGPNRTVSMTCVLSDGTVVKMGSESIPNAGKIGGAQGPGMMLSQLHFLMWGKVGIITDMTVEMFPAGKYRRYYVWVTTKKNFFEAIDWWYKIMRLDLCNMFIGDSDIITTAAQIATPTYKESEELLTLLDSMGLYFTCLWVGQVHADTQKELDAKCRMLEKITQETEGAPMLLDTTLIQGLTGFEKYLGRIGGIGNFVRKTRNTINYFREKEVWWCTASLCHPCNVPRYYDSSHRAIRQHQGERDPWAQEENKSHFSAEDTEFYMCSYYNGRIVLMERDYFYSFSNPYGFYNSRGYLEQASYNQHKEGMMGGWHEYLQFGDSKSFLELARRILEVFDPRGILAPGYDGVIEERIYGGAALAPVLPYPPST